MTVSTEISRNDRVGTGFLDTFIFEFEIYAKTDIKVWVDGVPKYVDTHFTVPVVGINNPAGGTIVFTGGNIPILNANIAIILDLPLTQLTDYVEGDKFPAETHETALDRLVKLAQAANETYNRCLRLPPYSVGSGVLPTDFIANYFMKVNSLGTGFELHAGLPYSAPGGANKEIQFNDVGILGADPDLTWDKTNKILCVRGFNVRSPELDIRELMDGLGGRPTYAQWFANQTTTDVIAVITAALNSGVKTVIAPDGHLKITSPIVKPAGVSFFGMGRLATFIEPSAQTFPAITINGANTQFEMGRFTINYGIATGNVPATNPLAKGISILTSGGLYPYMFSIRDVSIFYPYNGIYSDDLAFMYELSNIFVESPGGYGIYFPLANAATTVTMNNVYVARGKGGFNIQNLLGLVMNNCATDGIEGQPTVNILTGCTSILNSFTIEGCTVIDAGSLFQISGGISTITGYKGYGNIYDESVATDSYGIRVSDGARTVFVNPKNQDETHTGAGTAYAMVGEVGLILGHTITAPVGGTSVGIYTGANHVAIFDNQNLLSLYNDLSISQLGKGIILINAAGDVTKRVRLNDAGNGLIYEAP